MRLTVAEISFDNLAHNLDFIRANSGDAEIMPIVKANAYGHGMTEIASELMKLGISLFGVAFIDEAVELRTAGIKGEIFVLLPEQNQTNAELCVLHNLTPAIYLIDFFEALNEAAKSENKRTNAHLFVNTGMNREGVSPDEALSLMQKVSELKNVNVNGICTHFATASSHIVFANQQLEKFNSTLNILEDNGFSFERIHASNSAASILLPDARFNTVRPGLALYGYSPTVEDDKNFELKPVMTLKSNVVSVRRISEGETAGYGMNYVADKETNIALIPIGYGDGYSRQLSNKAHCLIKGKRYPLIGVISMDSCIADVGDDIIQTGDEVVLLGSRGDENISAFELAEIIGTIPYEVLTSFSKRVPRIYKRR